MHTSIVTELMLTATMHLLVEQLNMQTGGPSTGEDNTLRTVPKPRGSAGRGQRGFHLQDEMGLGDDVEGQRRYNMILVSTTTSSLYYTTDSPS